MENNDKRETDLVIMIMAGGLGTRMNSNIPKVLHKINNIPLIIHILNTSLTLNPYSICIIVGKYKDLIESTINNYYTEKYGKSGNFSKITNKNEITCKINYIIQNEPLGTGHAIMCCKNYLGKLNTNINNCLVLSGDVPFIKATTLEKLFSDFDANILVAYKDDPFGYGRIVFNNDNKNDTFSKIVEEKDCTEEEKKIQLINGGIYFFKIDILLKYIDKLTNNNNNKEYYLTQLFELFSNDKVNIDYTIVDNLLEITGINTEQQLNELEQLSSTLEENSI